jgi:hypothetical protein
VVEEAEVEARIVGDQRAIAEEFEQILDDLVKRGLSARKVADKPCTASAPLGMLRSGLK